MPGNTANHRAAQTPGVRRMRSRNPRQGEHPYNQSR
jgi:hypothetical protein